jgi:hypothetical protein
LRWPTPATYGTQRLDSTFIEQRLPRIYRLSGNADRLRHFSTSFAR